MWKERLEKTKAKGRKQLSHQQSEHQCKRRIEQNNILAYYYLIITFLNLAAR